MYRNLLAGRCCVNSSDGFVAHNRFCYASSMKSLALLLLFSVVASAYGAAPTSDTLRTIADRYLAKQPAPILDKGFSMDEALGTQRAFVDLLKPKLGAVAGYKIGLITKAGQERFGATGPVHG